MAGKIEEAGRREAGQLGLRLWVLDRLLSEEMDNGMKILELRVKRAGDDGSESLVIVKAAVDGQRYVAFHAASNASEAIRGAVDRITNADIKWKEDKPYGAA